MLTNFDQDRQWFNTLIPASHESAAVAVDCRLYFTLEWTREVSSAQRYTTADIQSIVEIGGTSETVERR